MMLSRNIIKFTLLINFILFISGNGYADGDEYKFITQLKFSAALNYYHHGELIDDEKDIVNNNPTYDDFYKKDGGSYSIETGSYNIGSELDILYPFLNSNPKNYINSKLLLGFRLYYNYSSFFQDTYTNYKSGMPLGDDEYENSYDGTLLKFHTIGIGPVINLNVTPKDNENNFYFCQHRLGFAAFHRFKFAGFVQKINQNLQLRP